MAALERLLLKSCLVQKLSGVKGVWRKRFLVQRVPGLV